MGIRRRGGRTLLGSFVIAGVVAAGSYAFTASNTVPTTNAGQGTGSISGYTASTVAFNLNASNPANVDSVTFTITPTTATMVKAQFASGGTWYVCTNTAGSVSCATTSPQLTASATNQLQMVAIG